ncbi:MAG: putative phosphothreonine lyase domain-containing protein [Candidatus Hodarchaeota archaeon]
MVKEFSDPHERRKQKQIQQSQNYSEKLPSEVSEIHWIYACRQVGFYPESTPQSGKWLVFVPNEQVDAIWRKIKKSTEKGELGDCSKVSTKKPLKITKDHTQKVICVYTYDWTDQADVMRIRENLREIGITQKIVYKTNEDTLKGRYVWKGDTNIHKYFL